MSTIVDNHYQLSGSIVKPPRLTSSPAGIQHVSFVVEHRSEQLEAGFSRRSFVRIVVVVSGDSAAQWANDLKVGDVVHARGFLNRIEDKNGIGKLVLHAQQLVKI